jgi:hypothetical protein
MSIADHAVRREKSFTIAIVSNKCQNFLKTPIRRSKPPGLAEAPGRAITMTRTFDDEKTEPVGRDHYVQ